MFFSYFINSVNKTEPRKADNNDTYACTWLVLWLGLGSVEPVVEPSSGWCMARKQKPFQVKSSLKITRGPGLILVKRRHFHHNLAHLQGPFPFISLRWNMILMRRGVANMMTMTGWRWQKRWAGIYVYYERMMMVSMMAMKMMTTMVGQYVSTMSRWCITGCARSCP